MIDHRAIVANVLKVRPEIVAKRADTIKIPSIIRAEFTREREKLDDFRQNLRGNIAQENEKQRERFKNIKKKYDKEGVEIIEDESRIGQTDIEAVDRKKEHLKKLQSIQHRNEAEDWMRRDGSELTRTRSGKGYKPGGGGYLRDDFDL